MQIPLYYGGNDGIIIGDGLGIPITHTSSTTLTFGKFNFKLNNVLCAPTIKRNLIYVLEFCKNNNDFVVKDLNTRALLIKGQSNGSLYKCL